MIVPPLPLEPLLTFLISNLAIVPLLVIVLLTPLFVLEVIVPMLPLASFLIPFVMVLVLFRVSSEIVPLLLTILPIEEVPFRVRFEITPSALPPLALPISIPPLWASLFSVQLSIVAVSLLEFVVSP